jgi:hypothetical protein
MPTATTHETDLGRGSLTQLLRLLHRMVRFTPPRGGGSSHHPGRRRRREKLSIHLSTESGELQSILTPIRFRSCLPGGTRTVLHGPMDRFRNRRFKGPLERGSKVGRGIWPSKPPKRGDVGAGREPGGCQRATEARGGCDAMGIGARRMLGWALGGGRGEGRVGTPPRLRHPSREAGTDRTQVRLGEDLGRGTPGEADGAGRGGGGCPARWTGG